MPRATLSANAAILLALVSLAMVIGLHGAIAQSAEQKTLQYLLTEEPNRLNFNPVLMRERSDALLEYALAHEDCDSLHLATFLAMQADVVMDEPHDPTPFDQPWACTWRHAPLYYVQGVLHYDEEDYEAAAADFRMAATAAALFDAADQQIFALHALGSVEMNRLNHREALAVYERAYALDPDFHLPTHLNNLAYASYIVGDCDAAMRWCDLAADQLVMRAKELPETYFEGDRNVILLTRLLVALSQANEPEMQSIIDQINFRDPFAGRERIAIAAVTQALQATNRPRAFEALRPTFESWLSDLDSTTIAAELGANRHLFAPWHPASSPISSEEWSKLRALPSALRGLPEVTCSVAVQSPADASTNVWPIETWRALVVGSLCLALLGAWLLIREYRLRRALQATFNAVPAAQRAILDQALYMNVSRRSLLKARALIALRMLRHEEEIGALADENLTGQERLALVRLRAGKTADAVTKETGLPRRKLKALQGRMGLSVGLLLLLASFPSEASAETLPADSAWQWLERGDSAAWFSALASGVVLAASDQVPDAVTMAFAAKESRPAWAEIGDDQIWAELRHALPVLMDERQILEGIQSPGLDPGVHAEHWEWERSKAWRSRLGWAFSTAALVLLSALVLFLRNRTLLNSLPNDVAALDAAWGKGGEALLEALPESLTLAAPKPGKRQDRWGLLSASEQEVAIYLAEGLSAVAIAHRMSCTTRYIYNMRSSIRKKWDLDADTDLMGAIRSNVPGV